MRWAKGGLIFRTDRQFDWMVSHASVPVADHVSEDVLRIYLGVRDASGRSQIAAIDVDAGDPTRIRHVYDRPVLELGQVGTFDDNGMMPSWIVNHEGRKLLYYTGWNPQVTVAYRLAIGLAVSDDGGSTFTRRSEGPICDRDIDEPYFNASPCVMVENELWRMWYVSCTGWTTVEGRTEPRYHIKYAESSDGITWLRTGVVCVDYDDRTQAIARPSVFRAGTGYRMLFPYRMIGGYRTDVARSYRIGYAESGDGRSWVRMDERAGIEPSASGWDSEMIEYPYVYQHGGSTYLLYNGNGFGVSGVGYAVLETWN